MPSPISNLFKPKKVSLQRESNNFDVIRLVAAVLVIVSHAPHVLGLQSPVFDPFQLVIGHRIGAFAVLTFFIISGYLVAASWERKESLLAFVAGRVLRIYPAAIVVVLLSVFLLGPLLTTRTLPEYFSSALTHRYLENMSIFRMHYYLPGVFGSNPMQSVNASLWTLPYEVMSYAALGFIGFVGVLGRQALTVLVFVVFVLLGLFITPVMDALVIPLLGIDLKTFYPLLLYFLAGTVFYVLRARIPLHAVGLVGALVGLFLLKDWNYFSYASLLLLPYVVFSLAFSKPLLSGSRVGFNDVSYGMYLYAFPVQQLLVFCLGSTLPVAVMVVLSILLTLPLALISWRWIERPALRLRQKVHQLGRTSTED